MEIERKFLPKSLPEGLERYPSRMLEQGYLCTDPVVRVRRDGDSYYLTCKGKGLLSREEMEFPLNETGYLHLLEKCDGFVIRKERFRIPCGQYTIELDRFAEPFAPLLLAEVEFPSVEEAMAFQPPEWFGEDVTEDRRYTNAAMSRSGCVPGKEKK